MGARVDSRTSAFGVLSGHGRILLLVVLGLTLIADVALYIAGDASSWRTLLISVVFTFVIALFAWWPVVAATGLLLVALVEASSGQIGGHVLYLPAVVGMVVYVSPRWFAGLYGLAIVGIAGVASSTSESLTTAAVPALFLLGALSALIGWGFRSARVRERHLVLDVERLVHERAVELRGERERIADELHDIIAHDVTLVAMHVRVLDRVQDPGLRRTSQRAIRESADQALADIRRVLRIVRDLREAEAEPAESAHEDLRSSLEAAQTDLTTLGATVEMVIQHGAQLSSSIDTALAHIIRESATNVAKYAAQHAHVRIELAESEKFVELTIGSSLPTPGAGPSLTSSGYGLDRLRARASLLGGCLDAGPVGATWVVAARLPRR